jgi:hypothetical protein
MQEPPFTEQEMLEELRTIFLFEAEHIMLGAGANFAEHFIGFATEDTYVNEPANRVDLDRFFITGHFKWAFRAAFRPSIREWRGGLEEHDELITFMEGLPRIGSVADADTHRFMGPEGRCRIVVEIVHARWKLQWDEMGHSLTTRELALLANMSEGAVRNAMADKTENGLKAIPGSKPVSVDRDEALRWLSGRRGFVPIPDRRRDDRFLHALLRDLESASAFGKFVSEWCSTTEAATLLRSGWTEQELSDWRSGDFRFDERRALSLAQALGLDMALFAGKALEVTLRRQYKEEDSNMSE